MAYKMKMYDPKGNLVDVDRNKQNSLLSQGYSFKKPTGATTYGLDLNTGIETFADGTQGEKFSWEADPNDPTKLYRENVATGARLGDDYISAPVVPNATKTPEINPYEEEFAKYREQINALATETDPDYNENLEQLSPEEMDEEIL